MSATLSGTGQGITQRQDAQRRCGGAEATQAGVAGGNGLVVGRAEAEKVAEFMVASREPRR
jgi:hypothetical protein